MSYLQKDLRKFGDCTKLITRGVVGSSSHKYMFMGEWEINPSKYDTEDIVGVSVNGNRRGRIPFDRDELYLAVAVEAIIITDNLYNRNRSYNIGEREVAEFLTEHGYTMEDSILRGTWTKEVK
jgi:hypothetical protein